jgi:predicted S18 family serine protease
MSDARQALNAAQDAQAEKYANDTYIKAKSLLEEARTYLENGDFYTAKSLALEAKHEATLARQYSQNHAKEKK